MRSFFKFSSLYLVLAILAVEFFRRDGGHSAMIAVRGAATTVPYAGYILAALVISAVLGLSLERRFGNSRVFSKRLFYAFLGTVCFMAAFSLLKTLLPDIMPFYADAPLADFDSFLHGGADPWRATHAWAAFLPMAWIEPLYLQVWATVALLFPIILAVQDRDEERVRRFLILYAIAWAFLGNVVALSGLSAGPVYYDRLLDTDRFAELNAAIDGGFFVSPVFSLLQESLWSVYIEEKQFLGSGISAFPSVHVAVACVWTMYLCERSAWLAPVGMLFLASIMFLSVYSGYHYAVDGYFSILFIVGSWALLRRTGTSGARADARMGVPAE